mgnify:CR=1 FL=1
MQVVSLTEARNNLKEVFDSVYIDHEDVIIHRKGRENVVMISMDEYNSIMETMHLLSSKSNADRLYDSIRQMNEGNTVRKDINEEE